MKFHTVVLPTAMMVAAVLVAQLPKTVEAQATFGPPLCFAKELCSDIAMCAPTTGSCAPDGQSCLNATGGPTDCEDPDNLCVDGNFCNRDYWCQENPGGREGKECTKMCKYGESLFGGNVTQGDGTVLICDRGVILGQEDSAAAATTTTTTSWLLTLFGAGTTVIASVFYLM